MQPMSGLDEEDEDNAPTTRLDPHYVASLLDGTTAAPVMMAPASAASVPVAAGPARPSPQAAHAGVSAMAWIGIAIAAFVILAVVIQLFRG